VDSSIIGINSGICGDKKLKKRKQEDQEEVIP